MAYLAIARQWRPTQFDDLVGQSHVVQTLKNAIRLDRVSHAYLFSGARGIGKTSVARIFAKALRCPHAQDAVPCNQCPECQLISESRSVDVVEIDGASNNGVEAVRGIRENVAYGASSGKYKIYIIDEVHMLSISAFNALLKTLEEPPPNVVFMFATTEVQKIPLTILSRCQRFEFRRLMAGQIVERLQQIIAKEGFQIADEALRTIASHSDGSMRDAQSLLDQVFSYYGQSHQGAALSEAQVVEALGVNNSNATRALLSAILRQDLNNILKLIGDTHLQGVDLTHFAERCLEEVRLLYLISLSKETKQTLTSETLDISSIHFNELKELAELAPLIQIERMAQILSKTIGQLNWSSLPRFVLEMASIRMAKLDGLTELDLQARTSAPVAEEKEELPPPPSLDPPPPVLSHPQPAPPPAAAAPAGPAQGWKNFVDAVMKKRPLLGALLSHANFKMDQEGGKKTLHLAFPKGSFYERQASDQKNRSDIADHVRMYYGNDTELVLSTDTALTNKSLEENRRVHEATAKKSALEHPSVVTMKEALGADVVDIRVDNQS